MEVKRDITLQWKDPNIIEKGHKVYRSKEPMDTNNMPEAIASLEKNSTQFIDKDQTIGDTNYYRVSVWIEGYEVFSKEVKIEVLTSSTTTLDFFNDNTGVALFNFNGNLDGYQDIVYQHNITFDTGIDEEGIVSGGNNAKVIIDKGYTYPNPVTISIWAYLTEFRRAGIVNFGVYSFGTWLESNGTLYFCEGRFNDNPISLAVSNIMLNQWFHLCLVFDGNTGIYYIDGKRILEVSNMRPESDSELCIMGDIRDGYPNQSLPLGSMVDQLRIFNRSVNDNEVIALYEEVNNS